MLDGDNNSVSKPPPMAPPPVAPPKPPPAAAESTGKPLVPSAKVPAARAPAPDASGTARIPNKPSLTKSNEAPNPTQTGDNKGKTKRVPSWLVSLVFHLALLVLLALVPIRDIVQGPLTLILGEGDLGAAEFLIEGPDANFEDTLSEAVESVELPQLSPAESLKSVELPQLDEIIPDTPGETPVLVDLPFGISNGLKGRTGELKSQLLARYGGTAETESAVELGLAWLEKQQASNGSWSMRGPYRNGASVENEIAATALALNAFLGAGYNPKNGKYASVISRGLRWLTRTQDDDGFFASRRPREPRQQMYAQALASIAVIEAYGLSGDSDLAIAAGKAIKFAEWSQGRQGGWRYEPRRDSDLSVSGWFLMVLQTGRMTGIEVDQKVLDNISDYLDLVSSEEDSRYGYSDIRNEATLSMTAVGHLCRIYLGWPSSHPALLAAIRDDFLPTAPRLGEEEYSVYYWYYATQVLHHVGGEAWNRWNDQMKVVIPSMQEKSGSEAGSWSPDLDFFGESGRLYVTCLNIYCLEVYYRHLSLYEKPQ